MNTTIPNCSEILADKAGPPPMYPAAVRYILTFILAIIPLASVAGNALVILAVATHRKLRNLTNSFVVSLAFADCLVAVTVMPFGIYQQFNNKDWFLGDIACLIASSFDVMFCSASILHLLSLAVDRYLAICNPFFYAEKMNKRTVSLMLGGCWVIPIFISFIPIMNRWHLIGIEDFYHCVAPPHLPICYFVVNLPFAIIASMIAFYIPTVLLLVCYQRIYVAASKQSKQLRALQIAGQHHDGENRHKAKVLKQETKAAKTLAIIMGVYLVCWFPFFLFNLADVFVGYKIHYVPWCVALWLGYANSTINPFLYGFFNRAFKRAFLRIFRLRLCIQGHDYDNSAITGLSQVSD